MIIVLPPTRRYRRNSDWLFVVEAAHRVLIFYQLFRESARIRVGELKKGKGKGFRYQRRIEKYIYIERERQSKRKEKPRGLGYSRLCHGSCRDSRCIISHRSFSWLPGRVENGFQLALGSPEDFVVPAKIQDLSAEKFVESLTRELVSRFIGHSLLRVRRSVDRGKIDCRVCVFIRENGPVMCTLMYYM